MTFSWNNRMRVWYWYFRIRSPNLPLCPAYLHFLASLHLCVQVAEVLQFDSYQRLKLHSWLERMAKLCGAPVFLHHTRLLGKVSGSVAVAHFHRVVIYDFVSFRKWKNFLVPSVLDTNVGFDLDLVGLYVPLILAELSLNFLCLLIKPSSRSRYQCEMRIWWGDTKQWPGMNSATSALKWMAVVFSAIKIKHWVRLIPVLLSYTTLVF